jgi:tRNA-binding protein
VHKVRGMSPANEVSWEQFEAVDMRVGRVTAVDDFPEARRPAWKLTIEFGPGIGSKQSSAQITNYERSELEGRLVVAVVNFPPKRIGPFLSEVLVLGAVDDHQGVILLAPDEEVELGTRVA